MTWLTLNLDFALILKYLPQPCFFSEIIKDVKVERCMISDIFYKIRTILFYVTFQINRIPIIKRTIICLLINKLK